MIFICHNIFIILFSDRDECEDWGYCDQLCSNSFGSYKCSCVAGYKRRDDICVADPAENSKMKLIFAYHNKLVVMDKSGKTVRQLTNASDASGVDFHLKNKLIYFTDTTTRKIYKLTMPKDDDIFR